MVHRARGLVLAAVLAALAVESKNCQAQTTPLPPSPVPVVSGGSGNAAAWSSPPAPGSVAVAGPVVQAPPPPPHSPDPIYATDRPGYQPPTEADGWYFAIEADVTKPHVRNHLSATVNFSDGSSDTVQVPQAELDWTASPILEFGYRLPDNRGAVVLSYRFLNSEGKSTIPNFDALGDGFLKSRLNLNVWDLDYASEVWEPCPKWELHWKVGIRLADIYFDSQAIGQFAEQKASNSYFGAGPHFGLDLWRPIGAGFAFTSRLEGAALVGRIGQGFEETFVFDDGTALGGATRIGRTQTVPMVSAKVGLGWAPLGGDHLRLSAGYQYEHWWSIGDAGDSHAEIWDQGLFMRGEVNF